MTVRSSSRTIWDDLPEKSHDGTTFRAISGANITVARFELPKGLKTPPSSHPQEQFTYVISGRIRYHIGDEEITVRQGELLHVIPDAVHRAEVLEDSVLLDIFAPSWPDLPRRKKIDKVNREERYHGT